VANVLRILGVGIIYLLSMMLLGSIVGEIGYFIATGGVWTEGLNTLGRVWMTLLVIEVVILMIVVIREARKEWKGAMEREERFEKYCDELIEEEEKGE
jgi:uncharacterized membrane protein